MKQLDYDLREEWAQLPTKELEKHLDAELAQQPPNDETVLLILHILKDREPELPLELSSREAAAVKRYQEKQRRHRHRKAFPARFLSVAASVILVLTIFFAAAPQKAEAETFWEMLQRMTATVLEYFNPNDDISSINYRFKTDNPGLQQVYAAVVELGITEPVVPMWLPDGYTISSIIEKNTPMSKGIWVTFSNNNDELVYKLDVYNGEPAHQFYKDDTHYETYEWDGTNYNIARNNDRWGVVWTKENIECSIILDCQEDTLRRILRSIYVMEDG